ncbi:MAG TPA: L,D-transpeptidase family protein, partial [Candidatus Nitrosotenuis sp.]|nr:L,D-transpeptidase family protein [Candidatus Nitrosotenuis sp.]
GKLTLGGVISFQIKRGLLPDGVVGPITWGHLTNQAQPVTTTSFKGTGAKRIVVDKFNNIVFLVRSDGTVEAWGWSVDNNVKTVTKATSVNQKVPMNRNLAESGAPGDLRLPHFTRFDGGNGFHAIPIDKTGEAIHSTEQLGRGTSQTSLGCVRLDAAFAERLFKLPIGTPVNVVDQVTSRS